MKPSGPVPACFATLDGELAIAGRTANTWVAEAGSTPLFVYDWAIIAEKIARFRRAFPDEVALHFALKANPYAPLLARMAGAVDGLDVASGGELHKAIAAGADPRRISFAGPGKRDEDLALAVEQGAILNCESEGEAERTLRIAAHMAAVPRVAVRINPPFELKGSGMRMGGGAKPFGVDAERAPALVRRLIEGGADWHGFHIFAGSQTLDAGAVIEAQRAAIILAAELGKAVGTPPPSVNLGGGLGIPYFAGDAPIDEAAIGSALGVTLRDRPSILRDTRIAIELGRWLVGESGVYLTRILDRKMSAGRTFLVTDGGLQHQLAASGNFGQVIRRNFPFAIASRFEAPLVEPVTIVGCLCTPLDILADDVMAPEAGPGDLVAIFLAGAYGLSSSPSGFLSQHEAREILA